MPLKAFQTSGRFLEFRSICSHIEVEVSLRHCALVLRASDWTCPAVVGSALDARTAARTSERADRSAPSSPTETPDCNGTGWDGARENKLHSASSHQVSL